MKRILLPILLSSVGLAGCVVVPAHDARYGYAPPAIYVAPPALVVRPWWRFGGPRHWH